MKIMEVIYHTSDVDKDISSLENVLNSGISTIELDFVMSNDGVPIWTHDILPTQFLNSTSSKLKNQLTLFDILDINNHRCKLMLDIKYIPSKILNSIDFSKLLNFLNDYDEMQIQSLSLTFLNRLIYGNYPNLEIGLIVNVLTKWYINSMKIPRLSNLDFMALSSELWERREGMFLDNCIQLYPNVKKYAWTWSTRIENEDRINNFLDKNADGIITSEPKLVKSLIEKRYNQKI